MAWKRAAGRFTTPISKRTDHAQERIYPENAALLLIDHQTGTTAWTRSHDVEEIKKNAVLLAKIATATGLPLVFTSSMEQAAQGPLFPELEEAAPQAFANRIKRAGIVNAMHDPNFNNAVKATGRKKVFVAGITTEVCVVFPVLQLLDEGYEVQVVTDARIRCQGTLGKRVLKFCGAKAHR